MWRLTQYEDDGGESFTTRFNPCQGPIEIRLNPLDNVAPARVRSIERFITRQATVLSSLTGMEVIYEGRTTERVADTYKAGGFILLEVSAPGEGALMSSVENYWFSGHLSWDRIRGQMRERDAYQAQINANDLDSYFDGRTLNPFGRSLLMRVLGSGVGLDTIVQSELQGLGVGPSDPSPREVMVWDLTPPVVQWGPGDRAGLAAVGREAGCF